MGKLLNKFVMTKYGQMAKFGHLAIFGHDQLDQKYTHMGYPWKGHEKTKSPVKFWSNLDVWLKSYGQNKIFGFFLYVNLLCKTKNALPRQKSTEKILIFGFS